MRLNLHLLLAFSCGIASHAFAPFISTGHSHCYHTCQSILVRWANADDAENNKVTTSKVKTTAKNATKNATKKPSKDAVPEEVFFEEELTGRRGFSLTEAMLQSEGAKISPRKAAAAASKTATVFPEVAPKESTIPTPQGFRLTEMAIRAERSSSASRYAVAPKVTDATPEAFAAAPEAVASSPEAAAEDPPMPPRHGYSLTGMAIRAERSTSAYRSASAEDASDAPPPPPRGNRYSLTEMTLRGEGSKAADRSTRAEPNILQAQHRAGFDWLSQTRAWVPASKLKAQQLAVAAEGSTAEGSTAEVTAAAEVEPEKNAAKKAT
jgi:hypothetical protein